MTLAPKPKFNEIHEMIVSLSMAEDPNEFTIRKIEKEISVLVKTNALDGYILKGMLSVLKCDYDEVHISHKNAIKLDERGYLSNFNYAVSLNAIGMPLQALEITRRLIPNNSDNINLFNDTVAFAIASGQFSIAIELLDQLQKLSNKAEHINLQNTVVFFHEFINRLGITEKELAEFIDFVLPVILESKKLIHPDVRVSIMSDDEAEWLSVERNVRAPVEDVIDMNVALSECLATCAASDLLKDNVVIKFNAV